MIMKNDPLFDWQYKHPSLRPAIYAYFLNRNLGLLFAEEVAFFK
jgi:hypothetical protein